MVATSFKYIDPQTFPGFQDVPLDDSNTVFICEISKIST